MAKQLPNGVALNQFKDAFDTITEQDTFQYYLLHKMK